MPMNDVIQVELPLGEMVQQSRSIAEAREQVFQNSLEKALRDVLEKFNLEEVITKAIENGAVNKRGAVAGANASALPGADEAEAPGESLTGKIRETVQKALGFDGSGESPDGAKGPMSKFASNLDGLANMIGTTKPQSGLTKILGNFESTLTGLSGQFSGLAGILTRFAGVAALAVGALEVTKATIDKYREFSDVAISQTGSADDITLGAREWMQVQQASAFSGLSESEAASIQQNLISSRVAFGSEQYDEGFRFAQSARLNYAMNLQNATDLYVKAVVRGGMSINELNSALDSMRDTAQKTNATMSEVVDSFTALQSSMEKTFGSQVGTAVTVDLQNAGLTTEQQNLAGSILSQMSRNNREGTIFSTKAAEYMAAGQRDGVAYLRAALDSLFSNEDNILNGYEWSLLFYSQYHGYKSFYDYVSTGDWEGLQRYLDAWSHDDAARESYSRFISLYQRIFNMGENASYNADTITEAWSGMYSNLDSSVGRHDVGDIGAKDVRSMLERYVNNRSYNYYSASMMAGVDELKDLEAIEQALSDGSLSRSESDDVSKMMLAKMLEYGAISESDIANMTDDSMYSMLSSLTGLYAKSGESDFSSFITKNSGELRPQMEKYAWAGKDKESIDINIQLTLSDNLGRVATEKSIDYQWNNSLNTGDGLPYLSNVY